MSEKEKKHEKEYIMGATNLKSPENKTMGFPDYKSQGRGGEK